MHVAWMYKGEESLIYLTDAGMSDFQDIVELASTQLVKIPLSGSSPVTGCKSGWKVCALK